MKRPRRRIVLVACLALGAAGHAAPFTGLDQATVLMGQGRLEEALAELRGTTCTAEDIQSRDLLEGLLLHRLKRDVEAVGPLERALARDPGDFEAAIDLGQALQNNGRWDEARKEFKCASVLQESRPEPWMGLGQIAAGQGQWAESGRCFQRAAGDAPQNPAAWLGLSDALLKQGELRQAAEIREKVLGLEHGRDADLQFRQAVAWYELGDLPRSENALGATGFRDQPDAFFLAGCLAHRRGNFNEAERDYLAAIEAKGDYPRARLNLGITYYSEQRYDDAITQFDLLLQKGPDDQVAGYRQDAATAASDHYFRMGSQAMLAGDLPGAIALLQKSEALSQGNDKKTLGDLIENIRQLQGPRADQLDRQARVALGKGNLAQAVLLWQEALSLNPAQAGALRGLDSVAGNLGALKRAYARAAMASEEAGDQVEAEHLAGLLATLDESAGRTLRQNLHESRRRRSESLLSAGSKELELGHPRLAMEQFDRALLLDPRDPVAQARRQDAQVAMLSQVDVLLASALEAEVLGEWQQAYETMGQALAADPGDLEALQGRHRLAARLDLKRGDARRADDLYYQGVYAYGAGDSVKALDLWHEGLHLDPDYLPLREAVQSAGIKQKTLAALEGD